MHHTLSEHLEELMMKTIASIYQNDERNREDVPSPFQIEIQNALCKIPREYVNIIASEYMHLIESKQSYDEEEKCKALHVFLHCLTS